MIVEFVTSYTVIITVTITILITRLLITKRDTVLSFDCDIKTVLQTSKTAHDIMESPIWRQMEEDADSPIPRFLAREPNMSAMTSHRNFGIGLVLTVSQVNHASHVIALRYLCI